MVERLRRRRGMYDIAKTRVLLTTAVFALVAALYAGGANARIPDEDGPTAKVSQLSGQASSKFTGLLRAARTRDQESGAPSGQATTAKPAATPSSTRYGYVVGGELVAP
jgi:hypothetical protein